MRGRAWMRLACGLAWVGGTLGCGQVGDPAAPRVHVHEGVTQAPVEPPQAATQPLPPVAVPTMAAPPLSWVAPPAPFKHVPAGVSVEARVLVIASDGKEVGLPAITQALDFLGTPYTVWIGAQHPNGLTPAVLATGTTGHFQGIILATSNLGYNNNGVWSAALSSAEWLALTQYEVGFGARQVTYYTWPTADLGFGAVVGQDSTSKPLTATLTADGQKIFPYLKAGVSIPIQYAYTYLAPAAVDGTPLIVDGAGHALAVVKNYSDGRSNLALTFDGAPYLIHSLALGYGIVNWVTRGLFIGERKIFASAQVDDVFIDDDVYNAPPDETFRISGKDLTAYDKWQVNRQKDVNHAAFKTDLAYNGVGAFDYDPDKSLTDQAKKLQGHFKWISHTWDHEYLDAPMDFQGTVDELTQNNDMAKQLGLKTFNKINLVTPNISGLTNPEAMTGAASTGVRYLVSDTSTLVQLPKANLGQYNPLAPSILMIPRRPTNLYYNVSTPAEWAAEYNAFYHAYWGRDLTYQEILDKESDMLLRYMLNGECDPWMFHQPNLAAYDGRRSLLGDLIDAAFAKVDKLYNLPVTSPTMDQLGAWVAARMNADGKVSATITEAGITLGASVKATVSVTGLKTAASEVYGGQDIAHLSLVANQPVTLPLP